MRPPWEGERAEKPFLKTFKFPGEATKSSGIQEESSIRVSWFRPRLSWEIRKRYPGYAEVNQGMVGAPPR